MARCAPKEKQRRVDDLAKKIIEGWSQRQLMVFVQEEYGVSVQHAQWYIRHARDLIKQDATQVDRTDMLAAKIQMLEQIARDAVASGRESNAIGAIRLLSELIGLGMIGK